MSDRFAVRLHRVAMHFPARREPLRSLKEWAIARLHGHHDGGVFWAIRDLDLDLRQGDTLGVIGRNGAGKSTLLRLAGGIIQPSRGEVHIWGSVAPVIELSAGFDRELTGRENVLFNGSLLGIPRREMRKRMDEIVAFAQLEEVVDAPLRTYSSGMLARLAFAVATSVRADTVLLDEVLAVGDQFFRSRCHARIAEMCAAGTTLMLVSHDLTTITNLCRRAVWLDEGRIVAAGETPAVLDAYRGSAGVPGAART